MRALALCLLLVPALAIAQNPATQTAQDPDPTGAITFQSPNVPPETPASPATAPAAVPAPAPQLDDLAATYILGPDDTLTVHATDAEDIGDKPYRIDMRGYIRLPLAGRIRAAGLTIDQLESAIAQALKPYIQDPDVVVTVAEFRSQPVSVVGSVNNPGILQLQGRKTLVEIISMAGGLRPEAGNSVKITRRKENGAIPLKTAAPDATGQFSIAELSLEDIMNARSPEQNIQILPNDVITVPKADLVYVTGQVQKSGGFTLSERESMTVLQALSLAGGLDRAASPQNSRILRAAPNSPDRTEIAVDVRKIMNGQASDVPLQPDDILFVPSSASKKAALRAVEAAIQLGTGVVIWRR